MSPRARNGANNRRELGISSDTMGRAVLPALVSEERTLFRGGGVGPSSSTSIVIVAIVPDIRDSKYFVLVVAYVVYIIHPANTVLWTTPDDGSITPKAIGDLLSRCHSYCG